MKIQHYVDGKKRCPKCKRVLSVEKFYKGFQKDKLMSWCSNCVKIYRREHYKVNMEKEKVANRKQHLKRSYNLTPDEYQNLLTKQHCVCAICGKSDWGTKHGKQVRPSVDHDHVTKKVRGLLCYKCNWILGLLHDDIGLLSKIAHYLYTNSQ